MGAAVLRGVSEFSLAGGADFAASSGAATAVVPLGGEAGSATGDEPLPEVRALLIPPVPPRPRLSGCTDVSAIADRSTRPNVARSSAGRNFEPIQRKM
jgi:hypothetical protein